MVEVLAALSMMNAATVAVDGASSFCEFFLRLLSQLEIKCSSLPNEMQYDEAFQGLMIPRFVFPGTSSDCSCLDNIGIYERSANAENIDATLHGVQGVNRLDRNVRKLYIEAKPENHSRQGMLWKS